MLPPIGCFWHLFRLDYSLPVTKRVQLDMNKCAIIVEIAFRLFSFFRSSLAHLEPEVKLFEVWEINVRQIIIIANGINSQTPKHPNTPDPRIR